MTAPAACSCGTVQMNACAGHLDICLTPGYVFDGTVQLRNRLTKLPMDWPDGTSTRMRFSWGTGTELIIGGSVGGSYLRFHMGPDETEQLPRGTMAYIDVNYDVGDDPDMWLPWRKGRLSGCH